MRDDDDSAPWLTNYHTHSLFCDGKNGIDEMADDALAKGFRAIGFSSHAPVPFPTKWAIDEEELPAYVAAVRACAERLAGKMEVKAGLEIDFIEGLVSPADPTWDRYGLDYKIGSAHFVSPRGETGFSVDGDLDEFARNFERAYGSSGRKLAIDFFRAQCALVEEGGFDLLGHFDLIRKNDGKLHFLDQGAGWYRDAWMEASRLVAERGVIAEINTGGMARGKTLSPYPEMDILREWRRLGVRVTINSDAHSLAHTGSHHSLARELALEAGFRSCMRLGDSGWYEVPL